MIPKLMQSLDRWALWKIAIKKDTGKPYKLPIRLQGSRAADATNLKHWGNYKDAAAKLKRNPKNLKGLAFTFVAEDDLTVFDFDEFDSLTAKQQRAIRKLCKLTYAETSQSGNGYHVFFRGHDPRIHRKKFQWLGMKVEVYRADRFIAVTGKRVKGSPDDLAKYKKRKVEKCLGPLPDVARENIEAITSEMYEAEPTITRKQLMKTLKRESKYDKDARAVLNAINDGASNNSDDDFVFCKTLLRYGAVPRQVDEILIEYKNIIRSDNKLARNDYRKRTISGAVAAESARLDDFGDVDDMEGERRRRLEAAVPHKKRAIKEYVREMHADLEREDDAAQKKLAKRIEVLDQEVRDLNRHLTAGMLDEQSLARKRSAVRKLSRKINKADIRRMNRLCGEVSTVNRTFYAVYHSRELRRYPVRDFLQVTADQKFHTELEDTARGLVKLKIKKSTVQWLESKGRLRFPNTPVMQPSPDVMFDSVGFGDKHGETPFNLFRGCLYQPVDTGVSCEPIERHIYEVWCDEQSAVYEYVLNWLARMVQYPGVPAETALVLKSIQGVGKNKITQIFRRYYGTHYQETTSLDDLRKFNAEPMRSVMLVLNEINFSESRNAAGMLKNLITEREVRSEEKFESSISTMNCLHMVFMSNNDWIVPIESADRRYVVLYCRDTHMKKGSGGATEKTQAAYFEQLIDNCIDKGGDSTFICKLLDRDISKFNPRHIPKEAFDNDAHREQREHSLSWFQKWVVSCAHEGVIHGPDGDHIEWHDDERLAISNHDLQIAFDCSPHAKRGRGATVLDRWTGAKVSEVLTGCRDVTGVKSVFAQNTKYGRGKELPARAEALREEFKQSNWEADFG